MNVNELADEVIGRLRACTDRERQEATRNYFPSKQENLGVYAADMRAIVRDVRKRVKAESAADVLKLAFAIIARNTLEGRQAAYEIVEGHKPCFAALSAGDVEKLGEGIDNWASVDGFACGISGKKWREGVLKDADIKRWARSRDPWWRRAALVSSVPLNLASRGGRGDAPRTIMICEMAVGDEHVMVHKALSWALRVLSQVDPKPVRAFLKQHDAKLPALVKREVNRKLTTGKKNA
ncbi:MAG: DNA alkylation repair protein [Planctomycetes bacterium]|nr:DNA alkylation repair protein [Planctomycetota bacterium]